MGIISKPEWVNHQGQSIFSISIQPRSFRLATAGADNKIRIWNMGHMFQQNEMEKLIAQFDIDKQYYIKLLKYPILATLQDHQHAVNCIKFSPNGQYLASGADDSVVFVFHLLPGQGSSVFGSNEGPNIENWKVQWLLRGHSNNVTDLSWSLDNKTLASASLDNSLIIWNVETGRRVQILEGHSSFVKGVAFDPIGKYLASQSDDRSVIIWRIEDWVPIKRLTDPFKNNLSMNFTMRIDWAPTGQYLIVGNAYFPPNHLALLIKRSNWESEINFVGHNSPVVSVKCNPRLFYSKQDKQEDSTVIFYTSIGSIDTKVSVWTGESNHPIFIGEKLFVSTVSDLDWTQDGYNLICSSLDGTICLIQQTQEELGKVVPETDIQKLLEEQYGSRKGMQSLNVIQTQDQIEIEQMVEQENQLNQKSQKLEETKKEQNQINKKETPKQVVVNEKVVATIQQPQKKVQEALIQDKTIQNIINPKVINTEGLLATREKAIPNIALDQQAQNAETKQYYLQNNLATQLFKEVLVLPHLQKLIGSITYEEVQRIFYFNLDIAQNQIQQEQQDPAQSNLDKIKIQPKHNVIIQVNNEGYDKFCRPQSVIQCLISGKKIWNDIICSEIISIAGTLQTICLGLNNCTIQVYNPVGQRSLAPLTVEGIPVFINLQSKLIKNINQQILLCVANSGNLILWNLDQKQILMRCNLEAVAYSSRFTISSKSHEEGQQQVIQVPKLKQAFLASSQKQLMPVVQLTDLTAYSYHKNLDTWLKLVDNSFQNSQYSTTLVQNGLQNGNEFRNLQVDLARHNQASLLKQPQLQSEARRNIESRAHIEQSMANAVILKLPQEYLQWLQLYVKFLYNKSNQKSRLESLCQELLGPIRYIPKDLDKSKSVKKSQDDDDYGKDKEMNVVVENHQNSSAQLNQSQRDTSRRQKDIWDVDGLMDIDTSSESEQDNDTNDYNQEWDPILLGLDKRQLLKEVIMVINS